jgi:hypothetical protein
VRKKIKNNKKKILALSVILLILITISIAAVIANYTLGLAGNLEDPGNTESYKPTQNQYQDGESIIDSESTYKGGKRRIIKRDSNIDMTVDNVDPKLEQLRTISSVKNGYVVDYNKYIEGEWKRAVVDIEVPAENFFSARDQIVKIGDVKDEKVSVDDETEDLISMEAKRQFLQERKEWLESNKSDGYYLDESERREDLRNVREEIKRIEFEQDKLKDEGITSTITVDMQEPQSEKPPRQYYAENTIRDSFVNGYYGGLDVVKKGITALGYIIPFLMYALLVAILVGFTVRSWRYWNKKMFPYLKSKILSYMDKLKDE